MFSGESDSDVGLSSRYEAFRGCAFILRWGQLS